MKAHEHYGWVRNYNNIRQESKEADTYLTHLGSQITPCGQVFKPEKAVPVACTSPTWVMVDHLVMAKDMKKKADIEILRQIAIKPELIVCTKAI